MAKSLPKTSLAPLRSYGKPAWPNRTRRLNGPRFDEYSGVDDLLHLGARRGSPKGVVNSHRSTSAQAR